MGRAKDGKEMEGEERKGRGGKKRTEGRVNGI